jgi:hypothetical protein
MGQRQGHFNREIASLESQLLEQREEEQALPAQQSWEELPPVVQLYFHRVFAQQNVAEVDTTTTPSSYPYIYPTETIPAIQSLRFRQTGSFRLDGNWLPLARQTVSQIPNRFCLGGCPSLTPTHGGRYPKCQVRFDALVSRRAYHCSLGVSDLYAQESTVSKFIPPGEKCDFCCMVNLLMVAEAPLIPPFYSV